MREIKFRAWAVYSKDMFSPETEDGWELNNGILYPLPGTILEQYTGLKDKNGKEIYEGDILAYLSNYEPYNCVMEWHDDLGSCGCCFPQCTSVGFVGRVLPNTKYKYSVLADGYEKMEIIGNIHENSDLLK